MENSSEKKYKRSWMEIILVMGPLLANYIQSAAQDQVRRKKVALAKKAMVLFLEMLGAIYLSLGIVILVGYYVGVIWVGFIVVGIILMMAGWIIAGPKKYN